MAMRCKLLFILLACLAPALHAQVPEYSRHISKSFHISNPMSVEISNKYGRIHIIPWDVDSVKFNIDIRLRAKDNQKLEKMKQNVDFEFTPSQYFLVARTKFGDKSSDVFKDLVDIAGSYLSSSNSVTINYTVMVPAHVALKIENKFGDVYLNDHNGTISLILSYGDLKANRLTGRSDIKVTSGDAEIDYIKEGIITMSYVDLHIREAGKITANTQSSVITIDQVSALKLNSRRDKLYFNEIGSLSGESYFSAVNITSLQNNLTISSRYGDINIDDIRRSFSMINITSELTDLALNFERPVSFEFDFTYLQTVTFAYPSSLAKLSTKVVNEEEKISNTSGNFGAGTSDSKVTIKALRKCNLTISQH
jgi:hypothetical protein